MANTRLRTRLYSSVGPVLLVAMSLATVDAGWASCAGPGAPTTTQTKCLTAILIPGNPLQSFDISWVDADRGEYYLADRANAGIDVIDTHSLMWKRTIPGFVGVVLNGTGTAVDNNHSGPDGVTSHGRWLYAGDGNSTLKVIDLNSSPPIKQTISTGGTTRVDEMALTTDGKLLLAANNAEDPPFATLFKANGDAATSNVSNIARISVNSTIMPTGAGLSLEQPAWDPKTQRFYTSIPIIANNPTGCEYGQTTPPKPITCHGGLLVVDPSTIHSDTVLGAYDSSTNTGVEPLPACSPNGATVGPDNKVLMLGCTPGNNPSDNGTTIIKIKNFEYTNAGITGSDEVWYNSGDNRYYLGASKMTKVPGSPLGSGAVLGVVNGTTNIPVESIPQSSNSHSVAADSKRNLIFVPQVATTIPANSFGHANVGADANFVSGGSGPTVGQGICGSTAGCIAVYKHDVDKDEDEDHHDDKH
jgi:hypothetical protein